MSAYEQPDIVILVSKRLKTHNDPVSLMQSDYKND